MPMADLVSDIKTRLSIEDVVSNYIPLKRIGRSFKALCPFHNEKTPSFVVSPEKQLAYCFGCSQGGDMFKFVELIENIDFVGAMKILAERAGLDWRAYNVRPEKNEASKSEKDILCGAHEAAAEYFAKNLWSGDDGKKVLKYLRSRGLSDSTIREFNLGFAPDEQSGLINYLVKKGFQKSALVNSGLVVAKDVGAEAISDKFKMRLMFPITDLQGRIIGFGGRALKDGQEPKYLNSPETNIYHKSLVLYGLSYAKKFIKEANSVLIVEGYMDYLACYQAGIKNVVASSGTALTPEHARMIKRFTQNAVASFDNDVAGFEASKRAFMALQDQEVSVKLLKIPFGKDPADAVKKNPEKFKQAITDAKPFFETYLEDSVVRFDLKQDSGILAFLRECLDLLNSIKNNILQDIAVRNVANKLGVKESKIYDEMAKHKIEIGPTRRETNEDEGGTVQSGAAQSEREHGNIKKMSAQNILLSLLFIYPELFESIGDRINEEDFETNSKSLYKTFTDQYNNIRISASEAGVVIADKLDSDSEREQAAFLSLYAETKYEHSKPEAIKKDFEQLINYIVNERISRRKEGLKKCIREAEKEGKAEECRSLLAELQQLCSK